MDKETGGMSAALQEDSEARRMVAVDVLRSLVREIILTPENGELQIDVRGDLAGILAISLKSKRPAGGRPIASRDGCGDRI